MHNLLKFLNRYIYEVGSKNNPIEPLGGRELISFARELDHKAMETRRSIYLDLFDGNIVRFDGNGQVTPEFDIDKCQVGFQVDLMRESLSAYGSLEHSVVES